MRWWYTGDLREADPIGHRFPNGTPLAVKMAESVEIVDGGCHEWQKARNRHGYGIVVEPGTRRTLLAHRVAFALCHEREPRLGVLHLCHNPPCCNPAHLHEGDQKQNARDTIEAGRPIGRYGTVT